MKGRDVHVFSERRPRFSRNSAIPSILLLTWFFLVVTVTTVNCQDTRECVTQHSDGIRRKQKVVWNAGSHAGSNSPEEELPTYRNPAPKGKLDYSGVGVQLGN